MFCNVLWGRVPRTAQYDRQDVIDAVIGVARRDGLRQVTARRVARELGASTSVLYREFDSVDAMRDAAIAHTIQAGFAPWMPRVPTEGLRAIVHGFCELGLRDTWLVEQLAVSPTAHPVWAAGRVAIAQMLAHHPRYAHLDDAERLALISRFTMACVGVALSWGYGELTDIDEGHDAVVEPVIAKVLAERPRDDLLAGRPRP
jgi:AcrR family transcriptional regulator